MLGGILKPRVLLRIFRVAAEFYPWYRRDREIKFYRAEFCGKALKSRLYKILKSRFYALKFYARRSFKFRFGGYGPCAAAPNTYRLKFCDNTAEFLRGGALKFYHRVVKKIRITEKFSKTAKFHRTKFRYAIKFYHPKFYLLAKFYRSAEFKRLQYCATSAVPYARSGFCR